MEGRGRRNLPAVPARVDPRQEERAVSPETLLVLLKGFFALLALVAVGLYIVRPVLRMLREKPDVHLLTPDFTRPLEDEELEIPTEAEAKGFDRNAAIQQARADPRATATLVQNWLRQRK